MIPELKLRQNRTMCWDMFLGFIKPIISFLSCNNFSCCLQTIFDIINIIAVKITSLIKCVLLPKPSQGEAQDILKYLWGYRALKRQQRDPKYPLLFHGNSTVYGSDVLIQKFWYHRCCGTHRLAIYLLWTFPLHLLAISASCLLFSCLVEFPVLSDFPADIEAALCIFCHPEQHGMLEKNLTSRTPIWTSALLQGS